MSIFTKVMSKGVHNIAFSVTLGVDRVAMVWFGPVWKPFLPNPEPYWGPVWFGSILTPDWV
jgi:hypothetical protein